MSVAGPVTSSRGTEQASAYLPLGRMSQLKVTATNIPAISSPQMSTSNSVLSNWISKPNPYETTCGWGNSSAVISGKASPERSYPSQCQPTWSTSLRPDAADGRSTNRSHGRWWGGRGEGRNLRSIPLRPNTDYTKKVELELLVNKYHDGSMEAVAFYMVNDTENLSHQVVHRNPRQKIGWLSKSMPIAFLLKN